MLLNWIINWFISTTHRPLTQPPTHLHPHTPECDDFVLYEFVPARVSVCDWLNVHLLKPGIERIATTRQHHPSLLLPGAYTENYHGSNTVFLVGILLSIVGFVFVTFTLMALCYRSMVVNENLWMCLRLVFGGRRRQTVKRSYAQGFSFSIWMKMRIMQCRWRLDE